MHFYGFYDDILCTSWRILTELLHLFLRTSWRVLAIFVMRFLNYVNILGQQIDT